MKIAFISDFFLKDGVVGGAELVDDCLIDHLQHRGHEVETFRSHDFGAHHIKGHDFFIVSNFTAMKKESMESLCDKPYVIYEHDHKYLKGRDPSNFRNFTAPADHIINKKFYRSAKAVFCQSELHSNILSKNVPSSKAINAGCSLWHPEQIDILRQYCNVKKNTKYAILDSPNPIKGTAEAESYCMRNDLSYEKIPPSQFDEFIKNLSQYEGLVFFPKTLETFCRVVVEARMVGCKVITNDWNGCTHEDWFASHKGESLIDFIESKQEDVVDKVCSILNGNQTSVGPEDITVILNCYRRPYNLRMQIDALRAQTKPPKEIWLWVNKHPDNEGFSFDSLGLDKVFQNDYNWKFYGRFAAALLADTEYVALYDDDTIPGSRWHENCLETMKTHEGIMGSAGIILKGNRYVNHDRCGWPTQNKEVTEVDLVGHSWFFKREWLRYLWQEKPVTWDNGEDIQFGFMAKIHGGIPTYCPPHPPGDKELHGSILGNELGIDEKATSTNSAISHQQFFSQRDVCVQAGLKKGWKTVKGVSPMKDFKLAFDVLLDKIRNKENFAFTRFSDGELDILKNKYVILADNHFISGDLKGHGVYTIEEQKEFIPEKHDFYRKKLIESYLHKQENYYKGICTGTDLHVGSKNFNWMIDFHEGDHETLTYSNLLINANYKRFVEKMVPLFADRKIVYVVNENAKTDKLPFDIEKKFLIGSNCFVNNHDIVEKVRNFLTDKEDRIVLCSAASLSNLIAFEGFKDNCNNTFLDIGSCLNPLLDLEGWKHTRGYLTSYWLGSNSPFGRQVDAWG